VAVRDVGVNGAVLSAVSLLITAAVTAFLTGRDKGTQTRLEQRDKDLTEQRTEIDLLKKERDEDRARFEAAIAELRTDNYGKDRWIEQLARQVRALRLGIIALGGDPDMLVRQEEDAAHDALIPPSPPRPSIEKGRP
jgi:septal ring factor EnvC (AmiA/AmiB activator)